MHFHVKAYYVPGKYHIIADTVSRLHEDGQVLHLEALINNWAFCHFGISHIFDWYTMANHMSLYKALYGTIIQQVQI